MPPSLFQRKHPPTCFVKNDCILLLIKFIKWEFNAHQLSLLRNKDVNQLSRLLVHDNFQALFRKQPAVLFFRKVFAYYYLIWYGKILYAITTHYKSATFVWCSGYSHWEDRSTLSCIYLIGQIPSYKVIPVWLIFSYPAFIPSNKAISVALSLFFVLFILQDPHFYFVFYLISTMFSNFFLSPF